MSNNSCNRLQGKVAIVTGIGSSGEGWGTGKATAVLFAREGAKVCGCDVNMEAAEETCRIIKDESGECLLVEADVTNEAQVENMVQRCIDEYGRIDILDNNVGIATLGGPVETSVEDWDRVVDVNLKSVFLTCKFVIPQMLKQGGGSIINLASVGAIRTSKAAFVSYSASKAGLLGFTQNVALQYAREKIRINVILPGKLDTPMIEPLKVYYGNDVERMRAERNAGCPTGKMGDAWDIAYTALFLASNESKYITGTQIIVDGGESCCSP